MKNDITNGIEKLLKANQEVTDIIIKKGGVYWRYFLVTDEERERKVLRVLPFDRVLTNEQVETLRSLTNSVEVDMEVWL